MSLAEPSRFEVTLHFENSELDRGELVDRTENDIRLWVFCLGLDYILHR